MFYVSLCGPSKRTLRCYTSICDGIIVVVYLYSCICICVLVYLSIIQPAITYHPCLLYFIFLYLSVCICVLVFVYWCIRPSYSQVLFTTLAYDHPCLSYFLKENLHLTLSWPIFIFPYISFDIFLLLISIFVCWRRSIIWRTITYHPLLAAFCPPKITFIHPLQPYQISYIFTDQIIFKFSSEFTYKKSHWNDWLANILSHILLGLIFSKQVNTFCFESIAILWLRFVLLINGS